MRRIALIICLLVCCNTLFSQHAQKPKIMVVPSDVWCQKNGYVTKVDNQGTEVVVPDYKKALQNDSDIRVLISAMGEFFAQNDFELTDLEQNLKNLEKDNAVRSMSTGKKTGSMISETPVDVLMRTAQPDIVLDLDYKITNSGPRKQVSFNLQAIDAYSSKILSGNTGVSSMVSSTTPLTTLLEEVVLSFKDNLLSGLRSYFDKMFEQGREIKVHFMRFDSCPFDFEEVFNFEGSSAELSDIIEIWFYDHTVEGRYSFSVRTANTLEFDQVRMPLFTKVGPRTMPNSTDRFLSSLKADLERKYNIPSVQTISKGLGEIWVYLGDEK